MSNTSCRCRTPSREKVIARQRSSTIVATLRDKFNSNAVPLVKGFPALSSSLFCLYMFYTECYDQNSDKPYSLIFVAFLTTFANAFARMPIFKDDSFLEFRILLDYAQEILPLPCLCSEIWAKYEIGSFWLNYMHAALGFVTFFFYVVYEIKRIDLTDLTILINTMSLVGAGVLNDNMYAISAALIFFNYYYFKRRNEECRLKHTDFFNNMMITFNAMALLAFEPKQLLPDFLALEPPPPAPKSKSLLSIVSGAAAEDKIPPPSKKGKKGKSGVEGCPIPQNLISLIGLAFYILNI